MPVKYFEQVIHTFIASLLDFSNILYVSLDHLFLYRLQLLQNAAALLLTGTKKHNHFTPIFVSLHWLPSQFSLDYKILLQVFYILLNRQVIYQTLLSIYNAGSQLRSINQFLLSVPKIKLKSKGNQAFADCGMT